MNERSERHGARPGALVFADVDETLIVRKSMADFLAYYLEGRHGAAGAARARRAWDALAARAAAGEPRDRLNRAYQELWSGERADQVDAWGRRWFAERSAQGGLFITPTRYALLRHQAGGAAVVLVSGSLPAVLGPIAEAVGAAEVCCTRPLVRDGVLTGGTLGEPLIGEAKGRAVRELLARHPWIAAADCWAYGDHLSDLPMLAEVGHPVIVGDSPALARLLPRAASLGRRPCSAQGRAGPTAKGAPDRPATTRMAVRAVPRAPDEHSRTDGHAAGGL